MRGFQKPAIRSQPTELQRAFRTLSRHRRTKLARAAHTTLLKADQWSRGGGGSREVAAALEGALKALQAKGPRKSA
jgi:hypothetical protein